MQIWLVFDEELSIDCLMQYMFLEEECKEVDIRWGKQEATFYTDLEDWKKSFIKNNMGLIFLQIEVKQPPKSVGELEIILSKDYPELLL